MNPALAAMFPNASQACRDANPDVSASLIPKTNQNELQVARRPKNQGVPNKTESEFGLYLEALKRRGDILGFRFEAVKVRVGDGCFYVPDFFVERDGKKPLFIEIKGFMRDDARVKFLASKDQHTWADWEMWRKDRKTGWAQIL